MAKSPEQALRDEITRFLAQKGWKSPTSPAIDLIAEWEMHAHPFDEPDPDVVKVVRRAGK